MKAKLSQTFISTSQKIYAHDSLTRTVLQGLPLAVDWERKYFKFQGFKLKDNKGKELKRELWVNSACHTNIFNFLAGSIF